MFLVSIVGACSDQSPTKPTITTSNPATDKTVVSSADAAADPLASLTSNEKITSKLAEVNALEGLFYEKNLVNQALCDRLQKLRNQCAPITYMVDDIYSSQTLTCGSQSVKEIMQTKFKVTATGASGQIILVADGGPNKPRYCSSPFNANGQPQEIKWNKIGSVDLAHIRFLELKTIEAKAYSGNAMNCASLPSANLTTFSLTIGESTKPILTSGDLSTVFAQYNDSLCRVSNDEVKTIESEKSNQAKQDAASYKTKMPTNVPADFATQLATKATDINAKILAGDTLTQFLSRELTQGNSLGCWFEKSLEKLEIVFYGSTVNPDASGCMHQMVMQFGDKPDMKVQFSADAMNAQGAKWSSGGKFSQYRVDQIGPLWLGMNCAGIDNTHAIFNIEFKVDGVTIADVLTVGGPYSNMNFPLGKQNLAFPPPGASLDLRNSQLFKDLRYRNDCK